MNIYHQVSHVFVFEDTNEKDEKREQNGTLKLVKSLDVRMTPDFAVMHAIRKNFLRKVLIEYLSRVPIPKDGQNQVPDMYIDTEFSIQTAEDRMRVKQAILTNTDEMDPRMLQRLYDKLVFELKLDLENHNLVPDLVNSESNEMTPTKEDKEKTSRLD